MGLTIAPIRSRLFPEGTNEPHDELLDLALPLREFNALARNGIQHVDDLEGVLERGDHIPGIGQRGWEHIHDALSVFRERRGEAPPQPRAEPTSPPQGPVRSYRGSALVSDFRWTVLEEERLLAELSAVPNSELRLAMAKAAERRGVTVASISGKYSGLSTSARADAPARWTTTWVRRLHEELAAAGNDCDAALAAWAKRRRCTVEDILRVLAGDPPPAAKPRPAPHRISRPRQASPRAAAASDFESLTLPQLLDLDRRVRSEMESRIAAMTVALSRTHSTSAGR